MADLKTVPYRHSDWKSLQSQFRFLCSHRQLWLHSQIEYANSLPSIDALAIELLLLATICLVISGIGIVRIDEYLAQVDQGITQVTISRKSDKGFAT